MGSIYLRGHTYWLKYYRNGRPYRESAQTEKESEAKRLLRKREGEIAIGKTPGVYFDRITFDDLAKDFLTDYRINGKKSLVRAERSVNQLKETFTGYKVPQITSPRIKAYIEKRLNEDAANATINRELAALKRMFNLAVRQTPPKIDRVPYIPMMKEDNVRKGFFEHGEFQALWDALPSYLKGFTAFAYKTGWRVSEIEGLTWAQVDLANGIVRLEVGETKNNEGRTVYLDSELLTLFKQIWDSRSQRSQKILPYIFVNESGTDRIKEFRGAWRAACTQAKIGHRLFHDLRRTAVRNMVRAGIPERVAMMISGHKTRSVFERYNIVNDTDLKLASQKQQTYLQAQMGTNPGTVVEIHNTKELAITG